MPDGSVLVVFIFGLVRLVFKYGPTGLDAVTRNMLARHQIRSERPEQDRNSDPA